MVADLRGAAGGPGDDPPRPRGRIRLRARPQGRPARVAAVRVDQRRRPEGSRLPYGDRRRPEVAGLDRKSTRLNSSHSQISYAVFCLKKKKRNTIEWSNVTARNKL